MWRWQSAIKNSVHILISGNYETERPLSNHNVWLSSGKENVINWITLLSRSAVESIRYIRKYNHGERTFYRQKHAFVSFSWRTTATIACCGSMWYIFKMQYLWTFMVNDGIIHCKLSAKIYDVKQYCTIYKILQGKKPFSSKILHFYLNNKNMLFPVHLLIWLYYLRLRCC